MKQKAGDTKRVKPYICLTVYGVRLMSIFNVKIAIHMYFTYVIVFDKKKTNNNNIRLRNLNKSVPAH